MQTLKPPYLVDLQYKSKHKNSLMQSDDNGHGFVFNLFFSNVKSTLNYFSLAVLLEHYEVASYLSSELYSRT